MYKFLYAICSDSTCLLYFLHAKYSANPRPKPGIISAEIKFTDGFQLQHKT